MATNRNRSPTKQACVNCKTRKKKCDRRVPSCAYCIQKDLDCHYSSAPRRRKLLLTPLASVSSNSPSRRSVSIADSVHVSTPSDRVFSVPERAKPSLYYPIVESLDGIRLEAQRLIHSTGQFVDDITAQYFQTFHRHLPIISRVRFQNNLIASGGGDTPDTSLLLLSIYLVTNLPAPELAQEGCISPILSRQSLYLATKSLLAQAQACLPPSLHLIQANLLVAMFEYAGERPETAFVTISSCARMAYTTRIHQASRCDLEDGFAEDAEEARNTWWGIVIHERAFLCETSVREQPLATPTPSQESRLPIEYYTLDRGHLLAPGSIPNVPLSSIGSTEIKGFGRAAQAACFLGRTMEALNIPDSNSRLELLEGLDLEIQAFLGLVLDFCKGQAMVYCTAIAMAVRALFLLHGHVMDMSPQDFHNNHDVFEARQKSSLAALDTVTNMVVDTAECHHARVLLDFLASTPPCHSYMVRAAIQHVSTRQHSDDVPWSYGTVDDLRDYLGKFVPSEM